jgi:aspartate/methionine/tyrosine aminotransferase
MTTIEQRFNRLSTDGAPGQELRQGAHPVDDAVMRGSTLSGTLVDFSHGDVGTDAFAPTPGAFEAFTDGVRRGGEQAYTEYRGAAALRKLIAGRLADFTQHPVSAEHELIITPGTQGALFLALGATIIAGDKVAIVQPDYFANRKIVEFLGGVPVYVDLAYLDSNGDAGIDLDQLESAFKEGAKVFLFSNPNNPTGAVYSAAEIGPVAALADRYGAIVIVDQLYSRLRYDGTSYVHVRAAGIDADQVITIMGPSKTESLSGYRLGVAFGAPKLIDRMEKLQAIVSLRAAGYCQAVLKTWFAEPVGWLEERIARHQAIRDRLLAALREVNGVRVRTPQAGSYIFPRLPALRPPLPTFLRILRNQAGVTVTPGSEFGMTVTDSVRLNFSQNADAAVQAIARMALLIDRYRA